MAGGLVTAPGRGVRIGADVLQIFSKQNTRWMGKALEEDEAGAFREESARTGIPTVAIHCAYLINLASAKEAVRFAAGSSRQDLDEDRKLLLAIIKSIEIIGEAAAKVSEARKAQNDNIPWNDVIGMRNRLSHGYFDINLDMVWETVQTDIPNLIIALSEITPDRKSVV